MDYINEKVKRNYELILENTKDKLKELNDYITKLENEKGKNKNWGHVGSLEKIYIGICEAHEDIYNY